MTMSAERIKNAAFFRFAAQGYDATSLAEIAGDVGIKPPSIYAHFRGKQALFKQLVEYAYTRELEEVHELLQRPVPVHSAMRDYLYGTLERFDAEPHFRFWLRSIYLPPSKMLEEISAYDKQFAESLEQLVSSALRHSEFGLPNTALPREILAAAYIGILRGVHAELLYCGGLDAVKILTALWTVFERALVVRA